MTQTKSLNKAAEISFQIKTSPKDEIIVTRGFRNRGDVTMTRKTVRAQLVTLKQLS